MHRSQKMPTFNLSEIFCSVQGEGLLVGMPSVFIRLAGCPLRCRWCDTPYALTEQGSDRFSLDQVLEQVSRWSVRHVVITGGEPLVDESFCERQHVGLLLERLKEAVKHVTIETSGVAFFPKLNCDLMSISPKLGNSLRHDTPSRPRLAEAVVIRQFIQTYPYQIKFVVDDVSDLPEIECLLQGIGTVDRDRVLLMPQARTRQELLEKSREITKLCVKYGFVFGQRLQVLLWDTQRGR
jgi:7-carboxy-7-deazaguanine synthase